MKKILFALVCLIGALTAFADTATITIASKKASVTDGALPSGATVEYSQTFNTSGQSTANNSATMTISGMEGYIITALEFETKSNKSAGAGKMNVTVNNTSLLSIDGTYNNAWSNHYTTEYEWIKPTLAKTDYEIGEGEKVVMKLECTTNSLYWDAVKITYAKAQTTPPAPADVITYDIWGNLTGNDWAQYVLTENENHNWVGTVNVTNENAEFGIRVFVNGVRPDSNNWLAAAEAITINADDEIVELTAQSPVNIAIKPGKYEFELDLDDVALYVYYKGEAEGNDPQPGTTTKTDVITATLIGASGTGRYNDFSNIKDTSDAVYAGNAAQNDGNHLQLRSTNSSGIVSTVSGGNIRKVEIVWDSSTLATRKVDVYGSNTAYTSAADLYDNDKKGTKLGTFEFDKNDTSLEIEGDYMYVGVRSNSGALYLESVSLTWGEAVPQPVYTDLWLRGYKSWDPTDENKFSTTDGVNYKLENALLREGTTLKVADATYGAHNYGGAENVVAGQDYTLNSNEGDNHIVIGEDLIATVNFNLSTKVFNLTKTGDVPEPVITYAIKGNLQNEGWEVFNLTEKDGYWTATIEVTRESAQFGAMRMTDGAQSAWYAAAEAGVTVNGSTQLQLVSENANNINIAVGKYNFALDPAAKTLDIELIPVAVPDVYKQVTKLSDLTPGSELVLFWEGEVSKEHKQFAMGTIPDSKKYFDVVANPDRDDNGNILVANDSQILIVTLVEGTKEGCFALKAGNKYISNTSSTNGNMSFVDKLAATCDIVASLEILKNNEGEEYESGLFIFQYVAKAGSDKNYFQCNVSSGSERFSNYKDGTQKNLMVFKKSTSPAVSEDPASLEFDGGFVEEAKEYTLRFVVADDAHVYYTSLERENMTQTEAEAEVEEPTLANATEWDGNPLVFHHAFIVKAFAVEEGKLNSPVKTHFVDEELATAVAAIEVETGVAEYFTLGGVRVAADSVMPGIYVRRQGNKTSKVLVK